MIHTLTMLRRLAVLAGFAPLPLLPAATATDAAARGCDWREPPRTYPEGAR